MKFEVSINLICQTLIPVSVYAAKVYDAVMLYARAVKTIIDRGGDPHDGEEVMTAIFNTTYTSKFSFNEQMLSDCFLKLLLS